MFAILSFSNLISFQYWGQALLDSLRHRRDPPGSDRRNNDSDSSDAEVDITMATDAEADEPVMTARAFPQGSHIMLRRTGTGPGAGARHPAIEKYEFMIDHALKHHYGALLFLPLRIY